MKTRHTEGNPTEARLATAGEIKLPLALEVSTSTASPSVAIRVSAYHLEGMQLAALASARGGDTPDRWATLILAADRLPKPARRGNYPDRPTGHVVTVTLPPERLAQLDARAARDGRPFRKWIHAVLVAGSAKYRATLDTRPAPPAPPAGDCFVSIAPQFGGARLTLNFDRELTERIEELAIATRMTLRESIALAVYQDKSASHRIAGTYYGNPGHSLTMDLDRAQLAGLTARARRTGQSVPDYLRNLLRDAPEAEPAPAMPANVLPFFTGHFRRA
jgi:hypothetical protein